MKRKTQGLFGLFCAVFVLMGDGGCGVKENPKVRFETNKGVFIAELFSDVKVTTKNFLQLVDQGFYNGLTFHRYVSDFVIQGGDPTGTGTGGSSRTIPLEIVGYRHERGALGMARTADPNSASSQFYIVLQPAPHLDGQYAVFGRVVQGMEVVDRLRVGDKMLKVERQESRKD